MQFAEAHAISARAELFAFVLENMFVVAEGEELSCGA